MAELTDKELAFVRQAAELHNTFCALPVCHPSDLQEFNFHIHAIQAIVMQRAAVRAHPDVFNYLEGFLE